MRERDGRHSGGGKRSDIHADRGSVPAPSMDSSPISTDSSPASMDSSPASMDSSPASMDSSPASMDSSPRLVDIPPTGKNTPFPENRIARCRRSVPSGCLAVCAAHLRPRHCLRWRSGSLRSAPKPAPTSTNPKSALPNPQSAIRNPKFSTLPPRNSVPFAPSWFIPARAKLHVGLNFDIGKERSLLPGSFKNLSKKITASP